MKTKLTCPLGHQCEKSTVDGIERCAWFIRLAGKNPQTGIEMDEEGCAMGWMPVLLIENANTNRGTASAVESFRNEMVAANLRSLIGAKQLPALQG